MLTQCFAGALAERLGKGGLFRLKSGGAVLRMTEDLVVKTGTAVFFDGGGRRLKTDSFGFRVEAYAKLCLYNTHLIDGTYDSNGRSPGKSICGAIEVGRYEAEATGAAVDIGWVTISGMTATTNTQHEYYSSAVVVRGKASLSVHECHFVGCWAVRMACMRILSAFIGCV